MGKDKKRSAEESQCRVNANLWFCSSLQGYVCKGLGNHGVVHYSEAFDQLHFPLLTLKFGQGTGIQTLKIVPFH